MGAAPCIGCASYCCVVSSAVARGVAAGNIVGGYPGSALKGGELPKFVNFIGAGPGGAALTLPHGIMLAWSSNASQVFVNTIGAGPGGAALTIGELGAMAAWLSGSAAASIMGTDVALGGDVVSWFHGHPSFASSAAILKRSGVGWPMVVGDGTLVGCGVSTHTCCHDGQGDPGMSVVSWTCVLPSFVASCSSRGFDQRSASWLIHPSLLVGVSHQRVRYCSSGAIDPV